MSEKIHPHLDSLRVPLDSLTPYHRNPRRHDLDTIVDSLQTNGQYRPIVANHGTHTGRPREILAGNGTWAAAKQLGWREIAVTWVDVDDVTAAKIVTVDNRASDLSTYDDAVLAELLDSLPDLDGTGYTPEDLDQLIANTLAAEEMPRSAGVGDPVVSYQIVFDNETQQATWYEYLRWLRREYPDLESIGERLQAHLGTLLAGEGGDDQ
ncbi:Phage protein (plasmid) [Carbonactinospora thermoautotrophica]|uniref:Phage protein n=1 Tax=Carbonactinospora thermoautotrophica TaxID=1469144 RepID=A0A132MHP2_9ACTN|nr:ParB N-terminal domain-containing protein [Carbonactinospora thermoautotrophica]KWW97372.1 Phage protein [Carbonactinospora thermoautotrophica]